MIKYEYISVDCSIKILGGASSISEHRKTIDEYSNKGYRYSGYVPTKISAYGVIHRIDLIFELKE